MLARKGRRTVTRVTLAECYSELVKTHISKTLEELARLLDVDIRKAEKSPLGGMWKGIKITERDIEDAKRAWSRRR